MPTLITTKASLPSKIWQHFVLFSGAIHLLPVKPRNTSRMLSFFYLIHYLSIWNFSFGRSCAQHIKTCLARNKIHVRIFQRKAYAYLRRRHLRAQWRSLSLDFNPLERITLSGNWKVLSPGTLELPVSSEPCTYHIVICESR